MLICMCENLRGMFSLFIVEHMMEYLILNLIVSHVVHIHL